MNGLKERQPSFTDCFSDPKAEEVASRSKCQLWSLSGDCRELPQAAMLTPPQEPEMDIPDVDTHGPGT